MNVKAFYQQGSKLSVWHTNRKKKNKQWNVTLEESLEGGDAGVSINHWIRKETKGDCFCLQFRQQLLGPGDNLKYLLPEFARFPLALLSQYHLWTDWWIQHVKNLRALNLNFPLLLEAEWLESALFCCAPYTVLFPQRIEGNLR